MTYLIAYINPEIIIAYLKLINSYELLLRH